MQVLRAITLVIAVISAAACTAQADQRPVQSRITSVGLFKNGLAVVRRTVKIPQPGTYRIEDVPEPVHGTFWIESDARLTARVTTRVVDVPLRVSPGIDFQEELAGKQVVIHFADSKVAPTVGTVVDLEPAQGEDAWSRSYQPRQYGYWGAASAYRGNSNRRAVQHPMLILATKDGRSYVDPSKIAYLEVKGTTDSVRQRRPVLLVSVEELKRKPATLTLSYLTKGMAWAPSYRVDISDPKTLVLKQKAVIKNELEPIERAEVRLISGYPGIRFAHVTSPLSLNTSWANFFRQLNQRPRAGHPASSNVLSQQRVISNVAAPDGGLDLSAVPSGEGVDLHFQNIGKHTLAEGDSLMLEVARGSAAYERIVEWIVPDTRRADGRHISEHERNQDPEKYQDAAWDAVRFKNPLSFPMTTGAAMIVANDRFNGESTSYWVNTGERTTLRVTKALSIRTRCVEQEEEGERKIVYVGGDDYRKTTVKGTLQANNHRQEPVTLVIRRRFSGDLLEADRSPKSSLREEGVYSINKRNELTWTLELEPAEEIELTYRYTVLVNH